MDYSLLKEIISYAVLVGVPATIWFVAYKFGSTTVEVEITDESIILKTNRNKKNHLMTTMMN